MEEHQRNTLKVGCSIQSPRTLTLGEQLGPPGKPYLIRWVLDLVWFSVRLHHWLHSDDMRAPHDHPWWFLSLCLWGCYVDVSEGREDRVGMGGVRFRRAEHRHSVRVDRSTWTLLITGPSRRQWGFWVRGKFRKRNKYFYEHGHHDPENPLQRYGGYGGTARPGPGAAHGRGGDQGRGAVAR